MSGSDKQCLMIQTSLGALEVGRIDHCPECQAYALHDVINLPLGRVVQCKNAECHIQWSVE